MSNFTMPIASIGLAGFTTLAAVLAAAGALPARAGVVEVEPSVVRAGAATTVVVSGTGWECAPIISHKQVDVADGVISLSAAFASNPAALCAAVQTPYRAEFDLPALKQGSYTVLLSKFPECAYSSTPCPVAVPVPDTGHLEARGVGYRPLYLDPVHVPAGAPATVSLRGTAIPCNGSFSRKEARLENGSLVFSFSLALMRGPCVDTVFDGREAFELPALPVGAYPVFLNAASSCIADGPLCANVAAQPVDTVYAVVTLGLHPESGKGLRAPAARRSEGARFRWRDQAVDVRGRLDPLR